MTRRLSDPDRQPPTDYLDFVADPLSIWIESTVGLRNEDGTGRLVRARPRSITGKNGVAADLSALTGVTEERCSAAIQEGLLGGYLCPNPETGFPAFAFRIHQFVSRGDTAYATIEAETSRYITVQGQQFVPGDRDRVLLPLVFCRECGQEYYSVRMTVDAEKGLRVFTPRASTDLQADADERAGYLHVSAAEPWPTDPETVDRPTSGRLARRVPGHVARTAEQAERPADSDPDRPRRNRSGEGLRNVISCPRPFDSACIAACRTVSGSIPISAS